MILAIILEQSTVFVEINFNFELKIKINYLN